MRKMILAALALAASLPAHAQTDTRQVLWQNLRVGMTKEEVKAIIPGKVFQLSPSCWAGVYPRYDRNGGLVRVEMESATMKDDSKAKCGEQVLTALITRYDRAPGSGTVGTVGDDSPFNWQSPVSATSAFGSGSASFGDYATYGQWRDGGLEVLVKVNAVGLHDWRAVYRLAKDQPDETGAIGSKL